jgi:hypothetical protein
MYFGVTTLLNYVVPAVTNAYAQLGTNFVRLQMNNTAIENPQGVYNWSNAQAAVNTLAAAGCNIVIVLQGFNSWWLDANGLPTPAGMINWGSAVINQFGQQIAGVEMGNEEYAFVSGAARNPKVYLAVAQAAYPVLHYVAQTQAPALPSGFTVGMFGNTNWTFPGSNNADPFTYYYNFIRIGGDQFVDYYNVHLYNGGTDPTFPDAGTGAPSFTGLVKAINNAQGVNNVYPLKQIRFTEFGWKAEDIGGCMNVIGPTLQAQYTIKAYDLIRSDSACQNVSHMYLYTCDATDSGHTDCHETYGYPSFAPISAYILNANN